MNISNLLVSLHMKDWQIIRRFEQLPDLPVLAEVDVLVIGGGAAGVAAAETAGTSGQDTWLIEKYGFCGGAVGPAFPARNVYGE